MKDLIRKEMSEKRASVSGEEIKNKSDKIKENLFSLKEFEKAKIIMLYVSKDNEVLTHEMIKECLSEKTVCVPVTDIKNKKLIISKIDSFDELKKGSFDILQPVEVKKIKKDKIDLVIIPGLAFDRKGSRIGYGIGYYDIFLKKMNVLKIALAFDFQITENIENQEHDVRMDMIITESGIIYCK